MDVVLISMIVVVTLAEAGTRRRRRGMERREERDRPLPPLLARVGGNIEVCKDNIFCLILLDRKH